MQRRLPTAATIAIAIAVAIVLAGCAGDDSATSSDGGGGTSTSTAVVDAAAGTGAGLPYGTPHVRWLEQWGSKKDNERVNAVVVDPDDAVVVAGTIGTFDAGPTPLTSVDAEDIILARFDADGELMASRVLSGPSQNGPRALARRSDGTYAMLGIFGDTFPAFEPALEAFGGPAVFVGTFDAGFESLWGRAFVGAATGRGQTTMTVTEDGALVVAGTFHDALVTEAGVMTATGPSDAYVARLSPEGDVEWLLTLGGPDVARRTIVAGDVAPAEGKKRGSQGTSAVAWLSNGDAIVSGNFGGTMLLGDHEAKSAGGVDAFVARVELAP